MYKRAIEYLANILNIFRATDLTGWTEIQQDTIFLIESTSFETLLEFPPKTRPIFLSFNRILLKKFIQSRFPNRKDSSTLSL